jgi:hypothetical protein
MGIQPLFVYRGSDNEALTRTIRVRDGNTFYHFATDADLEQIASWLTDALEAHFVTLEKTEGGYAAMRHFEYGVGPDGEEYF